jgi:hypothetical protein
MEKTRVNHSSNLMNSSGDNKQTTRLVSLLFLCVRIQFAAWNFSMLALSTFPLYPRTTSHPKFYQRFFIVQHKTTSERLKILTSATRHSHERRGEENDV